MEHEPLSVTLERALAAGDADGTLTLNDLVARTGARGPFALIVLLCLPFVTPLSLPGISNVFGFVIMLLAWRLARGQPARLPAALGERDVEGRRMHKVVVAALKVIRFLEKWVKPRRTVWLGWPAARAGNALVILVGGLLLLLPIPPTIPLSNMLPAYATILVAASMMEEDGWLIWAGYTLMLATTIYFAAMIVLQAEAIALLYSKYWHRVVEFFRTLA